MKKIFSVFLMFVFILSMGYAVYDSYKVEPVSDTVLANIEALADNESSNYDCIAPFTYTCGYEGTINFLALNIRNNQDFPPYLQCFVGKVFYALFIGV